MTDQPVPQDEAPEPQGLLADVAAWLDAAEVGYAVSSTGAEILLDHEQQFECYLAAVPGELVLFVPLTEPFPSADDQDRMVDYLWSVAPLPVEFLAIGDYATDDLGEVGLVLNLPMPHTFGPALLGDALVFLGSFVPTIGGQDTAAGEVAPEPAA